MPRGPQYMLVTHLGVGQYATYCSLGIVNRIQTSASTYNFNGPNNLNLKSTVYSENRPTTQTLPILSCL